MRTIKMALIATLVIVIGVCCKTQREGGRIGSKGPSTIIYKTRKDYSKNVPVTLSEDKSKIVSYPAPQDLFFKGSLAYPTPLAKGYLLDNRGVSPNTAFLSLTFEQYAKLSVAPTTDDLYKMIIDKDPITAMYNLGSRYKYKDAVKEIDSLIEHHKLKEFERLK